MKILTILLGTLAYTVFSPCLSTAQTSDYQTGKIVSVEKVSGTQSPSTGTDAPLTTGVKAYNLGIQLNDTLYTCRAKTSSDMDLDWTNGKEIQAMAKGKAMYVKRGNGKIAKLSIISSKKEN